MIDQTAYSDYQKFAEDLRHKNRFFVQSEFVDLLRESINLNKGSLARGSILYRARIHGMAEPKDGAFSAKDMYGPEPKEARRGRANPDGISYLYLSSDVKTCISEVAPRYGDVVTIGEFRLKSDIELIDLTKSFPIRAIVNSCVKYFQAALRIWMRCWSFS